LIGYDGIAIANSTKAPQFSLSLKDVFLALAKDIPGPDGKLIPNPNKTWKDVNPALPANKIEVLGPPPTSGKAIPSLKALADLLPEQPDQIKSTMTALGIPASVYDTLQIKNGKPPKGEDVFNAVAYAVREDGAYIEAGENDNLIVQKLEANPNALGVFGYSFLEENRDQVQGSSIDGIAPDIDSIATGKYPISRPLYFYIKGAHVGKIPGIQEFAIEWTSNKAIGEDGYLLEKGLIPLSEEALKQVQEDVKNLKRLEL
jgi:phosphate transport system substrate-binding protein